MLLAEAEVPYDQVFEMEDINGEFGQTDVVLVLGANDVVNPAAEDRHRRSPACLSWKPARPRHHRQQRSMASGYAGLDNELFYQPNTMMVATPRKVIEDMLKAIE